MALCREHGVLTCLGGTLLEIALAQDRVEEYAEWARGLGVDCVEVSNGALGMPAVVKQELVQALAEDFSVLSEVGTKAAVEPVAADWVVEMLGHLEAGAPRDARAARSASSRPTARCGSTWSRRSSPPSPPSA